MSEPLLRNDVRLRATKDAEVIDATKLPPEVNDLLVKVAPVPDGIYRQGDILSLLILNIQCRCGGRGCES